MDMEYNEQRKINVLCVSRLVAMVVVELILKCVDYRLGVGEVNFIGLSEAKQFSHYTPSGLVETPMASVDTSLRQKNNSGLVDPNDNHFQYFEVREKLHFMLSIKGFFVRECV